jgi:hypothetical protein
MPTLDDLIRSALAEQVQQGGGPTEQALFQRSIGDIENAYKNSAQQISENQFSRGLGLSSVAAQLQAENLKNQSAAIEKARQDAFLGGQQAQLAALGQAAGLSQGDANRAQQAAMQRRALAAQEGAANKQLIAGGITGGVGAAANLAGMAYRPEIQRGLRAFAGLGARPDPVAPGGGREMMLPPDQRPGLPSGAGLSPDVTPGPSLGDFSNLSSSIPDLSMPDFGSSFTMPDLSSSYDLGFSPSLDLSGLFDSASFSPGYDWSQIGWG